jgi:hypothetical protein
MNYKWTITSISAIDGLITHAHYKCVLTDDDLLVETEGNWWFNEPKIKVPFEQVSEEMVSNWIEQEAVKDGVCHIKSRLEEQLKALEAQKPVLAPWLPQVFTPNI